MELNTTSARGRCCEARRQSRSRPTAWSWKVKSGGWRNEADGDERHTLTRSIMTTGVRSLETMSSLESLREHLQWAIELEHSTIPPYFCALYSIEPGCNFE